MSLMIPGNRLAVGRVHDEAATVPAASDPAQLLVWKLLGWLRWC